MPEDLPNRLARVGARLPRRSAPSRPQRASPTAQILHVGLQRDVMPLRFAPQLTALGAARTVLWRAAYAVQW